MNEPIDFQSCTGNWQGTSRLHDPITERPEDSASFLIIQSANSAAEAEGAAVTQIDYTWAYQGAPQNGTILLTTAATETRSEWLDTWHTGGEKMVFDAEESNKNVLSLRGSYPAPTGPDWGWRIVLEPLESGGTLQLRMDNITSDGEETIAVEALYQRVKS